ncbi:helix-turn-helix domain-containing protein [Paracoccus sp. JM45]|uniref:helix-turn-helix domain-containing protein n=1 Tax=Paracoccus sp. JM45 TaxID=2283626 RepID=UPI001C71B712|nr:helix-turn-helix domain-containing protein [Paracoccus sp. JM45]
MARSPARGRGRPTQDVDLHQAILDTAKLAFAHKGVDETGLRKIASKAGVSQALLRDYFGFKQDLFDTVFRRRGTLPAQRRIAL